MARVAIEEYGLYNAGILACEWWDVESLDMDDVNKFYSNLRKEHGVVPFDDLELFCADWEDDELGLISQDCDIEAVADTYNNYGLLDYYDKKKLAYMTSQCGYSFESAMDRLDDCDCYEDMTMEELVDEFLDSGVYGEALTEVAKNNYCCLDIEYMARELSYDYTEWNGDIYRCN